MFSKSKRGARIMGAIVVLCGVGMIALGRAVAFLLADAPMSDDLMLNLLAELVLLPLVGGVVILLAAGVIYSLSEAHFGKSGAIRWALVGVGWGAWWSIASHALPPLEPYLLDRIVRGVLQVGALMWVYWLVFRVFPPRMGDV